MNVNVTFLKIAVNENLHVHITAMNDAGDKMDTYLSGAEWEHALTAIWGEAKFFPYYRDISYLTQVYSDGFVHVRLREYEGSMPMYFYFPLRHVLEMWKATPEVWNDPTFVLSWDGAYIENLKTAFAPRPIWEYRDYSNASYDDRNVQDSLDRYSFETSDLAPQLVKLHNIASNYSNGIGGNATIHMSFDMLTHDKMPDSYYFHIEDSEGHRILTGGVIFHPDETRDGKREYILGENGLYIGHYSMHT